MNRVNIGCGDYPLEGWSNLDVTGPDVAAYVPPMPFASESLDEVFAGHFLEHLSQSDADMFVAECYRCLKPGGKLGVVVPDFHEIVRRYLDTNADARFEMPPGVWHNLHDLDSLCHIMLFSTIQGSHHKWAYDQANLVKLLWRHGFRNVTQINKWMDPRISVGAWYQFGLDVTKE